MLLDPFYPIFDGVSWCERMVPLGIKLVQLRIKNKNDAELRAEIRATREICAQYDCQLIVNDYWKLAIEEGCDFIHLGQEDLDDADLDAIRASGVKLGVSSHDRAELERAMALKPAYIALGPVYPTILKKMKWHEQGLDRVSQWKAALGDIPLVGIGGMNVERAPGLFNAGADIVSVVTDITLNPDPEARVRQWIDITRAYVK
ncbi:thiamine-phosphate diphosphorylase [Ochrobactrum sp. BH3]|nr:thiamine-phosphate diphosphorylase [Ochrobactrum sp. BH3]